MYVYRAGQKKWEKQSLFVCLVFNDTFSINRLYRAIGVWCISRRAARQHKYHAIRRWKNTINQHDHKLSSAWALWRWSVATVRLPHRGLSSQSLGK